MRERVGSMRIHTCTPESLKVCVRSHNERAMSTQRGAVLTCSHKRVLVNPRARI